MIIDIKPIGIAYTPHIKQEETPIQPVYAKGIKGRIEIFKEYEEGLKDLDGFSYITVLAYFHKKKKTKLSVVPFLGTEKRGVFSTCAPSRPNHIGMSTLKLLSVKKNIIEVENIDFLNETPIIDIKPFAKKFNKEENEEIKCGWMDKISEEIASKRGVRRYKKDVCKERV